MLAMRDSILISADEVPIEDEMGETLAVVKAQAGTDGKDQLEANMVVFLTAVTEYGTEKEPQTRAVAGRP